MGLSRSGTSVIPDRVRVELDSDSEYLIDQTPILVFHSSASDGEIGAETVSSTVS